MSDARYVRVAALKNAELFRRHLAAGGIDLGFDEGLLPPAESPLAQPFDADGVRVGNRFCVLPMEGWDGTRDGEPSDLTRRRWQRFGASGAKLIWGGEAVAVRHDGRANPNQLMMTQSTEPALAALRDAARRVASRALRMRTPTAISISASSSRTRGASPGPNVWNRPEPLAAYATRSSIAGSPTASA